MFATTCPKTGLISRGSHAVQIGARGLATLLALAVPAIAQQSPPTLRINTPFAAPLWRLDVGESEKVFVSSSAYKAATIWSLDNPGAPRIARFPLREEQRRRAHGVAIMPSGDLLAYATPPLAQPNGVPRPDTARIYVAAVSDGQIVRTLEGGIRTRPQALKFSVDGRFLAAVLSSGCGLRVWETSTWKLVTSDDEGYDDRAHAGCCPDGSSEACNQGPDTTGVAFAGTPGAPVLITSGDTGVRTYSLSDGRFVRRHHKSPAAIAIERPEGIAVSPDGAALAIADRRERGAERSDKPIVLRIAVLALDTLEPVRMPYEITRDSPALEFSAYLDPVQIPDARLFSLHRVAWVADGDEQWIYAGGFFACEAGRKSLVEPPSRSRADLCLVRWSAVRPADPPRFVPTGSDRVMDILALKASKRLIIATQRSVSMRDLDGRIVEGTDGTPFLIENRAADLRGVAQHFSMSADAKKVYFDDYAGGITAPLRLMFDTQTLTLSEVPATEAAAVVPNRDANIVSDRSAGNDPRRARWWANTEGPPRFLGQPLADQRLDKDDIYRSVAVHLDSRSAVVGSANFLRIVAFGQGPPRIVCELPVSEEVHRVNIAPDGGIVVAGHSDGVLRWYKLVRDGSDCRIALVLSVYITRSAEGEWTWISWVPTGEFANHPAAQGLVTWQLSDAGGKVKTVDFSHLLAWYKDDVVRQALDTAAAAPARVGAADVRIPNALQAEIVAQANSQVLEIVSRLESTDRETFRYRVSVDPGGTWPRRLSVRTGDGVRLGVAVGFGADRQSGEEVVLQGGGLVELDLSLPVAARLAQDAFDLCFYLDGLRLACKAIVYTGPVAPPLPRRLFAVIAGFSRHTVPEMALRYAGNDAVDLARLLIAEGKSATGSFASVEIDLAASPSTPEAEAELAALVGEPGVRSRPPTREGLVAALESLATRLRDGTSNDLLVFYFSGHGFAHPFNSSKGKGLTALATPETTLDATAANYDATTLTSDQLISLIDRISAQKLVIIDACRTPPTTVRHQPFRAGALTQEFAQGALTTYFYFSARDGQYSIEQPDFAHDESRPAPQRGNGLFTFGLLKAMTAPISMRSGEARREIDTEDVMRFIEDEVFNFNDPDSIARRLAVARAQPVIQRPVYVVARPVSRLVSSRHLVLRTQR